MDVVDKFRAERHRFTTAPGVQPLIAVPETENFTHAVAVIQLQHQGADHIVEAGTQPATSDDTGAGFLRIEKQHLARPGDLEKDFFLGRFIGVNNRVEQNTQLVAHVVGKWRREAGLAQSSDVHG